MRHSFSRLVTVPLLAFTVVAVAGRTSAQTAAYFAQGTAQFVSQTDFVGTGQATHLGRYTEVGSVTFAPTANPAVLAITGTNVYTASNGDQLYGVLAGELDTSTGVITGTVTYAGGTGRFANAGGQSNLTGQMLGGGALTVAVAGKITF